MTNGCGAVGSTRIGKTQGGKLCCVIVMFPKIIGCERFLPPPKILMKLQSTSKTAKCTVVFSYRVAKMMNLFRQIQIRNVQGIILQNHVIEETKSNALDSETIRFQQ
jgi:hypothetical protein